MTDFRPHDGRRMPVKPDTEVIVQLRGFETPGQAIPIKAGGLRWDHRGEFGDITGWRRA